MRRALALLLAFCVIVSASPALAGGMVAGGGRELLELNVDRQGGICEAPGPEAGPASGLGIFLQRDPNGFQDSVNLYAFAGHECSRASRGTARARAASTRAPRAPEI